MSIVGERLRQARLRIGLSQKALGIKAGMDPFVASARVNQYERGKHVPDLATATRLADAAGVPSAFLYAQDDLLAAWILAYQEVTQSERRTMAKKVDFFL